MSVIFGSTANPNMGTVSSVASASSSLLNRSLPNPIVSIGTIDFEVQIIDITSIALAILEAGGGCLVGVMYRVTDFNHVIGGGITLLTAEFMTVEDSTGVPTLSTRGTAHSATGKYELSWDCQNDFISELYFPLHNQKATRNFQASPANCIENANWENVNDADFELYQCDINNVTGAFHIKNSIVKDCVVNFAGFAGVILNSEVRSSVIFGAACQMNESYVLNGAGVTLSGNVTRCNFDTDSASIIPAGCTLNSVHVGIGATILFPASAVTDKNYSPALNELQKFVPVNAGAGTIADSSATVINVNLNPAGVIAAYTFNLPTLPRDGQVFDIATTNAITVLTLGTGGHTVVGNIATLAALGKFRYQYELATDTFWLV